MNVLRLLLEEGLLSDQQNNEACPSQFRVVMDGPHSQVPLLLRVESQSHSIDVSFLEVVCAWLIINLEAFMAMALSCSWLSKVQSMAHSRVASHFLPIEQGSIEKPPGAQAFAHCIANIRRMCMYILYHR